MADVRGSVTVNGEHDRLPKFKKGGFPSEEKIFVQVDTEPDFIGHTEGEHEILSEAVQEGVSARIEKAVREIVDGLRTEQEQCKRSGGNEKGTRR